MIYTCTITPSIDYTTYLPAFKPGKLNRSNEVYYYPGGKGINVSRVLQRLQVKSVALGFAGGFTGDYIKQFLQQEGIETAFVDTHEVTRINVKVKSEQETELNGPGPNINQDQQQELLNKIQMLRQNDWFILAGSLPDSIPQSFYQVTSKICDEKGARFVLDTSGPALKNLIQTKPFLIKPNQQELGGLFNTSISSKQDAFYYAKKLVDRGVQNVIVSLGGDGAIFVTKELALEAIAPKGSIVNTVGSGDSLVSGFISSFIETNDPQEAFRYGVASGSATAFKTDLCRKEDVESLVNQVKINSFNE
ncbi:fructose-1-phosphate kinase [Virgibacillus subterraneus]|uniref:Tagatose-6-phosphate kinase n=1 Tax=Virgibacillus subterraneus TaxID=621109 RepID=A0A1H9IIS0_9BACI|nr:1-phosphofructokinase [Virgibacillus subterraneus]SEQ74372.1 fructose-1-phosphate kinase [Virgibacillus subterraneus]